MTGYKLAPNPFLMKHAPQIYCSMGHTAEQVAQRYGVSRKVQDPYAVRSHERAAAAVQAMSTAEPLHWATRWGAQEPN